MLTEVATTSGVVQAAVMATDEWTYVNWPCGLGLPAHTNTRSTDL